MNFKSAQSGGVTSGLYTRKINRFEKSVPELDPDPGSCSVPIAKLVSPGTS